MIVPLLSRGVSQPLDAFIGGLLVKPRAPRRKVMIKARMRLGASWGQVCILNISERGLGMQAAAPPVRGTYVEVRRGHHALIGCVTWAKGHRFGVRTQDCIAIDTIIGEPDLSQLPANEEAAAAPFERRAAPRPASERAERNRYLGRGLEFSFLVLLGISAAALAFETVHEALAAPISNVSAALDAG